MRVSNVKGMKKLMKAVIEGYIPLDVLINAAKCKPKLYKKAGGNVCW